MDWDDLQVLVALQRHGSLSAAARALNVNQTTVGRRLGSLEAQLGARLVTRDAAGYALTDAGRRACAIGETMEQAALALEREVGGRDAGVEGLVRITCPGGMVRPVGEALARLEAEHPRLRFHLLADVASLNLVKREADVALRMVNPGQPSLVTRRLGEVPWALFASDDYVRRRGVPAADLAGHSVIAFDETLAGTPGGRWLDARAQDATIVARVNNVVAAVDLAAAGLGVTVAPLNLAGRNHGAQPVMRPPGLGASSIFLVTHRDLAKVPRIRATMEAVATHVRAAMVGIGG